MHKRTSSPGRAIAPPHMKYRPPQTACLKPEKWGRAWGIFSGVRTRGGGERRWALGTGHLARGRREEAVGIGERAFGMGHWAFAKRDLPPPRPLDPRGSCTRRPRGLNQDIFNTETQRHRARWPKCKWPKEERQRWQSRRGFQREGREVREGKIEFRGRAFVFIWQFDHLRFGHFAVITPATSQSPRAPHHAARR